jgi:hypothetical protein
MSQESSASARPPEPQAARIGLDEFTEVTVRAVVRALGTRQSPTGEFKLPFPIIFGIWIGPEGPFGPFGQFERGLSDTSEQG